MIITQSIEYNEKDIPMLKAVVKLIGTQNRAQMKSYGLKEKEIFLCEQFYKELFEVVGHKV